MTGISIIVDVILFTMDELWFDVDEVWFIVDEHMKNSFLRDRRSTLR